MERITEYIRDDYSVETTIWAFNRLMVPVIFGTHKRLYEDKFDETKRAYLKGLE